VPSGRRAVASCDQPACRDPNAKNLVFVRALS
jgi:hypothetical protein